MRRLTSSSPPSSISSSTLTGVPSMVVGGSGSINGWPTDAKNRRSGCFGCANGTGFSRSVADTVRHNSGSVILSRKNAFKRKIS